MSTRVDHLYNPHEFPDTLRTGHVLRERGTGDLSMVVYLPEGTVGLVRLSSEQTLSHISPITVRRPVRIGEDEATALLGSLSNWDFIGSIDECLREAL